MEGPKAREMKELREDGANSMLSGTQYTKVCEMMSLFSRCSAPTMGDNIGPQRTYNSRALLVPCDGSHSRAELSYHACLVLQLVRKRRKEMCW